MSLTGRVVCLALIAMACGARTGLIVDDAVRGEDASFAPDVTTAQPDAFVAPVDAGGDQTVTDSPVSTCDAAIEATVACTTPVVQIFTGSLPNACKYDITWSCGGTPYHAFGQKGISGCDPGSDPQRGFRGTCVGGPCGPSVFDYSDPMGCSCSDTRALASLVAKTCGFPTP